MQRGRVIVLIAPSNAGKTTLAVARQALLADVVDCWTIIGVDDLFSKLSASVAYGDHVGVHADQGIPSEVADGEVQHRVGPIGAKLFAGTAGPS